MKNSIILLFTFLICTCILQAQVIDKDRYQQRPSAPAGGKAKQPPASSSSTSISPCSEEKMRSIRAAATSEGAKTVKIDCNCTFRSDDVITKQLIFEESNVVCDCNGATLGIANGNYVNYNKDMIQVRSTASDGTWTRPQNVTIKNCKINGSVRILGMGSNGEASAVKKSSRQEATNSQHVQRVRKNAPKNIVFDNITITGLGRNPFYVAPGVTYTTLINSEIKGKSSKVGIYLDAESGFNTIKNNYIHVNTAEDNWGELPFVKNRGWPQIAIDGSSYNHIINNRISSLNNGGIYFYRNCGEGGTIRHSPPEHNVIINNSFFYKNYKGRKPAIYLGSRDYGFKENTLGHCDADAGRPYGSSASDKDYARYNVIMQNQFYRRLIYKNSKLENATLSDMIRTQNRKINSPNYLAHNELISTKIDRKAGCYVEHGYKKFLLHGESIDVLNINGKLTCANTKATCKDGELINESTNCNIVEVPFECIVENNNNGCSKTISAPPGKKIVGVKVACNLEHGKISSSILSAVSLNQIKVVKQSDKLSDGYCFIGEDYIRAGARTLYDIQDQVKALFGCKEHDKNGGDCHIKGILYCR